MEKTNGDYSMENQRVVIEEVYGNLVNNRKTEFLNMIKDNEVVNSEVQ